MPFVLLIDLVLATPFGDVVDVRDGLRFVAPGDGGFPEALRPVEPGGGGFLVVAVDMSTNSEMLAMVEFLEPGAWSLPWKVVRTLRVGNGSELRIEK